MRIVQEFYCNECHGYFRITLNAALNINVRVKCPNCGHLHDRHVRNGVLHDRHSQDFKSIDEICPTKASYSKMSILYKSTDYMRNGQVIGDPEKDIILDRWKELYGDRAY